MPSIKVLFGKETDRTKVEEIVREALAGYAVAPPAPSVRAVLAEHNATGSRDPIDRLAAKTKLAKVLVVMPGGGEMTQNAISLAKRIEAAGKGMEDLDELVHEAASQQASGINNSSIPEQLIFLLEHGVSVREIEEVLEL